MIKRSAGASCLGERVSALADGALPDDVRDRSLVHVAGCADCRAALDVERLLIERLRALPAPAPSADLMGRLLSLGDPGGPLPPRAGRVAGTPRQPNAVVLGRRPAGRVVGHSRPATRREHPRSSRVLVVAAGALGVAVIALSTLGSALSADTPVVPPVDQLTLQRGLSGPANPFTDASVVRLLGPRPAPASAVPILRQVEPSR